MPSLEMIACADCGVQTPRRHGRLCCQCLTAWKAREREKYKNGDMDEVANWRHLLERWDSLARKRTA